jgi:hypothetical protein
MRLPEIDVQEPAMHSCNLCSKAQPTIIAQRKVLAHRNHPARPRRTPMFKKLAVMVLFALSLGTTVASFATPAHAAIDSFMYFSDY